MKKIFVAGHRGMVGCAICRQLQKQSDVEIITRTRDDLDLCDQSAVHKFMKSEKPEEVILAAAKVGGIHANNSYPAEFIYENLQILRKNENREKIDLYLSPWKLFINFP